MSDSKSRAVDKIKKWRNDPVQFVEDNFDVEPVEWQKNALRELADGRNLAVKAGRHCGKTAFNAWSVLWYCTVYREVRVPCVTPKQGQLKNQLWPEIQTWMSHSGFLKQILEVTGEKVQMKEAPRRHFAVQAVARNPENMQGFNSERILFICDESSGIPDEIIEAIEGSLFSTNAQWIMTGNPTRITGYFHQIWNGPNGGYGDFVKFTVNSKECSLADNQQIQKMESNHPPGTARHRMYIQGKFPRSTTDTFMARENIEVAVDKPDDEYEKDTILHFGVDVSRSGNNLSSCAVRMSDKIFEIETSNTEDVTKVDPWVAKIVNKWWTKVTKILSTPKEKIDCVVRVDSVGVGGGPTDYLKKRFKDNPNISVHGVHAQNKTNDDRLDEIYNDIMTASWGLVREAAQEGRLNLPQNEKLLEQFVSRKFEIRSNGKSKLESKTKMDGKSPDEADSVALSYAPVQSKENINWVSPVALGQNNGAKIN